MPVSESQKRARDKWNASRDNMLIRPDVETGARIRAAAEAAGLSLQQYLLLAAEEKMQKEDIERHH